MMDALAKLIRKRQLVKLCRVGVGVIAGIGAIQMVSQGYNLWRIYAQTQAEVFQGPQAYSPLSIVFLTYLPSMLANAALYFFYCLVLYAISVVFEALGAPSAEKKNAEPLAERELDEDGIVYTSLKPEEILQLKKSVGSK